MNQKFIAKLLHISDPTLPIGAFGHSYGLETYVQKQIVHDGDSTVEFIENMLRFNLKYNDGAFLKLAFQAAENNDLAEILKLDEECSALKAPREVREANQKLGLRLMKIFTRRYKSELLEAYAAEVKNGNAFTNYPIMFGLYAHLIGIPLYEALFGFYFTSVMGMITNAVKLVPLGQMQGQDILFDFYPLLEQVTEETLTLEREYVGLCNTSFDIRSMQHERLYSRLYMS